MARMTAQQKAKYQKIILDSVEEDYDGKRLATPQAKAKFIKNRFESEYGWAVQRMGRQRAMTEWLQGLAIDIPYMNHEIIEIAKKIGTLPKNASEREEDKLLENYWRFMAVRTEEVIRKYT